MPIGSDLSLTAHRSWKISSARLRVLQKIERGPVPLDQLHHFAGGMAAGMARPGDPVLGDQDRQVGLGAGIADDQPHRVDVAVGRQPGAIGVGVADRGGQRDPAQRRGDALQPRDRQRQQVAALLPREGVKLVDHHRLQRREHRRAVGIAEQQAQRLRRRQQDVRRPHALPRLAVGRRVAAAGLDADVEAHLLDRADEVALDVDAERFERRDVERVQPFRRLLGEVADGRQETGERLARAGGGDEQGAVACPRRVEHLQLVPPRLPAPCREPAFNGLR